MGLLAGGPVGWPSAGSGEARGSLGCHAEDWFPVGVILKMIIF